MSQLPDDKVLEQIQKLLNLAAKNPNENEAAAASAKANELLSRYNLDIATVERSGDAKAGKREEAKVDGGFYQHSRDLWSAVADLNFCMYWTQEYRAFTKSKRVGTGRDRFTTEGHVTKKRHALVGRIVNTRATIAMAQHLEAAIERATLERLGLRHSGMNSGTTVSADVNAQRWSNWAVSFRKGAAARVIGQLQDRRQLHLEAEAKQRRADENRAKRAGVSTATGMTIADLSRSELAANVDFAYGDGTWAKIQQKRTREAAERRAADEAHTKWAKENPEEARAQEEKERKSRRRYRGSSAKDNVDSGAYWSGHDAAADISLDQQVDKKQTAGMLR